jgi:hypothetical protein
VHPLDDPLSKLHYILRRGSHNVTQASSPQFQRLPHLVDVAMRNMLRNGTFALALMGSAAFLANPSFAVEPDTDQREELQAQARQEIPDFQLEWACCDDQTANNVHAPDVVVVDD